MTYRTRMPGMVRGKALLTMVSVVGVSLLLLQCTSRDDVDRVFGGEIDRHFADVEYSEFSMGNDIRESIAGFESGGGTLADPNGAELVYKWAFLTGTNGELISGFLGTSQSTKTANVALTKDQTRDGLRRCAANDDVTERFACMDRVVAKAVSDCQSSLSIEACHEHCWYDPGICVAN